MIDIVICRGIQGSGKSTWAKAWVNEDPTHRIRINWDDLRLMMGGVEGYWVPEREKIPFLPRVTQMMLNAAVEHGMSVVIDNMNLNPRTLREIFNWVSKTSVFNPTQVWYKDFKTPLDVCIERDSHRERPIGEKGIRITAARYAAFYEGKDEGTELLEKAAKRID